ncbi:MAG: C1 family peptidase, partial [Fidelibacterota bacterium]
MRKTILKKTINGFRKNILANPQVRLARNASIRNEVIELTMDWEHFRKIDHSFSDIVSGEMPATNQKSSGRCWGFAGLNLF